MLRRILTRLRAPVPERMDPRAPRRNGEALREIYLSLFDIQQSHALIDVTIDGVQARYQSIILDVDPERGTVTIDELFPPGFVGLSGQQVTVSVRIDDSRKLTFKTYIASRRADDRDIDTYYLALPENLDYNQRRGAFRLQLGRNAQAVSEFIAPDQQPISARIRDLSSTGIRVELPHSVALQEGDVLEDFKFEFAGRTFYCNADVRNLSGDADRKTPLTVGAMFRDLPRADQRSLERMIMQKQRQQAQFAAM